MGLDDERAHLIDSVPSYQEAITTPYNQNHNNQPVLNHSIPSSHNQHNHTTAHHYQLNQPTYQTIPQVVSVLPQVILVGGCPCCRVGVLEDDYSCLGICCAILFFPLGVLCCLATKQRRCSNCGAVYG